MPANPANNDLPIINIDDDPDNANWLRILAQRRDAKEQNAMADSLSSAPWDGSASNYDTPEAYCSACLVDLNDGGGEKTKSACHLPVREPGGAYNRAALGAAAAALAGGRGGGVQISPAAKKAAARKLASLYRRFKLDVPDSLQKMAM